jgi:activator of HSP90 ATPase
MSPKTRIIKQRAIIPAKPVQVYDAFLNARKHAAFTNAKAKCDPKPGGKFTAYDGYISGRIVKLERARRIVQEWQTTEWPEGAPPSLLEFTFRAKGDGTEVAMVHSKVPAAQADSYRQGWKDYYWTPLKEYFRK